MIVSGIERI